MIYQILFIIVLLASSDGFNDCAAEEGAEWVPYREDGRHDVNSSFFACLYEDKDSVDSTTSSIPGWSQAFQKCDAIHANVAYWTDWKQLAFYYHSMQKFSQRITDPVYFMALVNLHDKLLPNYASYIRLRDGAGGSTQVAWSYNRESMIRIQHGRFFTSKEIINMEVTCFAFRMERNHFADSDIDLVTCNRTLIDRYSLQLRNKMSHFICRKERAECDYPAFSKGAPSNFRILEGIYTYYYGTIIKRQQVPNKNLLADFHTEPCTDRSCDVDGSPTRFYEGDRIKYRCARGTRTNRDEPSQDPKYAVCSGDGTWVYEECRQYLCIKECAGNGTPMQLNNDSCVCDCEVGFIGHACDVQKTLCDTVTCFNKGKCIEDALLPKGYRCICNGSIGEHCEFELNECASNPCAPTAICIDESNGYQCICDAFSSGRTCENVVPYCERFKGVCQNGADCWSCNLDNFQSWCEALNRTQYICNCRRGYTGDQCSVVIEQKQDAWQVFAIVLGCMLFIIISLFCEIIGSRRRHDHDNLQVLLDSIDGYLKQRVEDQAAQKKSKLKRKSFF